MKNKLLLRLLDVITVFLIYYAARYFFGFEIAILWMGSVILTRLYHFEKEYFEKIKK